MPSRTSGCRQQPSSKSTSRQRFPNGTALGTSLAAASCQLSWASPSDPSWAVSLQCDRGKVEPLRPGLPFSPGCTNASPWGDILGGGGGWGLA